MEPISEVAQGPGWWLASDGRWYPPETHPSARPPVAAFSAPAPSLPPPLVPTWGGAGRTGRVGGSARPAPVWGDDAYRSPDDALLRRRSGSAPASALRQSIDQRGAFVAIVSLFLGAACVLPYYRIAPAIAAGPTQSFTALSGAFGSWRSVIPAIVALTVLTGIANSILRVGARGAVTVFVALRLLAFVQLALWVLALVYRRAPGLSHAVGSQGAITSPVEVTWVAWVAAAVAAVALLGSFASMGKRNTT